MIHYTTIEEQMIGESLIKADIKFIHESQNNNSRLDFYLPQYDVYLEVKRFYTPRSDSQLQSKENIILIQGIPAIHSFIKIITNKP